MKEYTQLTCHERIRIYIHLQQGQGCSEIGRLLGRDKSAISREIRRNSSDGVYFPYTAEKLAANRRKEAASISRVEPELKQYVIEKLLLQWSPEQISARLAIEAGSTVSHEWIYQMIQENRKEGGMLYINLRWGRKTRKKRFGGRDKRGIIPNRISIEERPAEANNRERIGDFEGDTIIGANHRGNLLTLVDRKSRLSVIRKLNSKSSVETSEAMVDAIYATKASVYTVTLDNGKEFAKHEKVTSETEAKIFFAHPYSSYERGTNENTNGLIRQYFPKKLDLSSIEESRVAEVENLLNHRPRKSLGFKTPYEVHYDEMIYYFPNT